MASNFAPKDTSSASSHNSPLLLFGMQPEAKIGESSEPKQQPLLVPSSPMMNAFGKKTKKQRKAERESRERKEKERLKKDVSKDTGVEEGKEEPNADSVEGTQEQDDDWVLV